MKSGAQLFLSQGSVNICRPRSKRQLPTKPIPPGRDRGKMPHAINAFGSGKPDPTSVAAFCEDRQNGSDIVETFSNHWAKTPRKSQGNDWDQQQKPCPCIGTSFAQVAVETIMQNHGEQEGRCLPQRN
jgi:hypothetical protein